MLLKSLTVLAALSLTTGLANAQSAWTGGDDLPTNPLACDGSAGEMASVEYDGGTPTGAPDRNGVEITVVDVPKLIGIGYFDATSKGISEAAAEMGNMTATTDGPVEANIDDQITLIDNYVTERRRRHSLRRQRSRGDRAGPQEGARRGHQRRRLRRQFRARRAAMVRQPGRVQRHRQVDDRLARRRDRRGRELRDRDLDLHHAQPGALDLRDGGLRGASATPISPGSRRSRRRRTTS